LLFALLLYLGHVISGAGLSDWPIPSNTKAPFGYADKPAEKHCWLICCERKILFRLKEQAEKDGL
jgi:hypothetical protein